MCFNNALSIGRYTSLYDFAKATQPMLCRMTFHVNRESNLTPRECPFKLRREGAEVKLEVMQENVPFLKNKIEVKRGRGFGAKAISNWSKIEVGRKIEPWTGKEKL